MKKIPDSMTSHFLAALNFLRNLLAAHVLIVSSVWAQKTDTLFYSVVKGGEKSGIQKIWQSDPHHYHSSYQYNDRGRGDSVTTDVTTDDSGFVIGVETNGVDYFKKPYHELYTRGKDSAFIVINDERKSKLFKGELFQSAEPTDIEPVMHYLVRHVNDTIPLATGGTLMMVPPHPIAVSFGGSPVKLLLYEYYYTKNNPPNFVWFGEDGHFFAYASEWFSTLRKGYETLADSLNILQLIQSKEYFRKQMKTLADTLPRLAVEHVRIFDSERAAMMDDMTVTIDGGTIMSIGKSPRIPQGYTIIDGTNKTLLPGLWDMHGHYRESEGLNYIAGGVTHVRDMGNSRRLPAIRDAIRTNDLLGPDISYMSGFIDQAGPFQGPTGVMIHNLGEGIKAVDDYGGRGYKQIKLYSSIDPAWVAPMAAEAHKLGMRVAGHIPAFSRAQQAVRAGYDEITHMNMVMLNFQGDTIDTRAMRRFSLVGERGKDLDLNSSEVKSFIRLLQDRHTSLDPTMNVFAGMLTVFPGDTNPSVKPILGWMPADERVNVAAKSSFAAIAERPAYDSSFARMMQLLKKLYDSGILIVAGTDGGEAFALEHELEIYAQAGIPATNVLQCATYNAAKDCNLLDEYGTIRVGKPADVILIEGNPAAQISDIRRVEWVIKNNLIYYPKKLLSSVGWGYYR